MEHKRSSFSGRPDFVLFSAGAPVGPGDARFLRTGGGINAVIPLLITRAAGVDAVGKVVRMNGAALRFSAVFPFQDLAVLSDIPDRDPDQLDLQRLRYHSCVTPGNRGLYMGVRKRIRFRA